MGVYAREGIEKALRRLEQWTKDKEAGVRILIGEILTRGQERKGRGRRRERGRRDRNARKETVKELDFK